MSLITAVTAVTIAIVVIIMLILPLFRISSSAQFCVVSPQVFGREVISLIWTIKMMMTTTTMMMMMMMMPTRWRSRGCEAQQQQP